MTQLKDEMVRVAERLLALAMEAKEGDRAVLASCSDSLLALSKSVHVGVGGGVGGGGGGGGEAGISTIGLSLKPGVRVELSRRGELVGRVEVLDGKGRPVRCRVRVTAPLSVRIERKEAAC